MSEIPQHMLRVRTQIAQRFIVGAGIEIGALHSPLEIGSGVQVKYVDRLPLDKLREHYPELQGHKIDEPDILDDGKTLSSIEDDTLDFIIANHMLEHCENPLGAIRNHLRKVRPGGILYYAIPEKTQSFDAARENTSFSHLVEDDLWGPEKSRLRHFWQWVTFVNHTRDPDEAAGQVEELMKINYSIHFHVWDEMSFGQFVKRARRYLQGSFEVVFLTRNDTELIAVFQKQSDKA
jgi:SAM-dependent methyltransferase